MMNLTPLVSVIIPTFNRAYVLQRAIDSVLAQTYRNFELIIIDDGSTDNTNTILDTYKTHEKFKVIAQVNQGVSAARNKGILNSHGEYICFLDSDDEWLLTKLESQIDFLNEYPEIICIHTDETWMRNGVRVNKMKKHKKGGGEQFIASLNLCFISPSTVLLHKKTLVDLGGFREDFPVCEDYDLWLKLTSLYKIGYIDTPLILKFGGHEDQLSTKFYAMDYYRILSIDWILKNRALKENDRVACLQLILKKIEILIKGKIKHGNLENLEQLRTLQVKWA